ncbi:MAG: dihydroneopterin aldolase [Flavobacteriales bacterium]
MSRITINNMRMHAYHGCWEEEAIIGGDYIVDVALELDFSAAAIGDDLSQTADYVLVREIVYREMAVRAKLIETVAHRINDALKGARPMVDSVGVRITKVNAPMGGQVESVSVEVKD